MSAHTTCSGGTCLCSHEPTPPRETRLTRLVATLEPDDTVRVHLNHQAAPVVGTLRLPGRSIIDPVCDSKMLFLDIPAAHIIRDHEGRPGYAVRDVELWDVDHRFDAAMDQAEHWLGLKEAHGIAPKRYREELQRELDEAKAEFIAEWIRAEKP